MATKQAAPAAEQSERAYMADLNKAIADTEDEIFTEALGADELDNDGDRSLEEMGDGLEGETEEGDADDEAEETEDATDDEAADTDDEAPEPEADANDADDQDQQRDQRGRFQGDRNEARVPPGRLKEEADRRRAAEERVQALERQVAEYNGRLTEISSRVNATPARPEARPETPPKPDMFAEPEKYEQWVLQEAERKAAATFDQRFADYEKRQQAQQAQRVDESFNAAARGPRGWEFSAAYQALTALDPRSSEAQATVRAIFNAPDPGTAMFDWWSKNGGEEYRNQVLNQLMPQDRRQARTEPNRAAPQRQQPRHEFRGPQRLPSLNSAAGSNSQRVSNPDMLNGSEESVFDFATRR